MLGFSTLKILATVKLNYEEWLMRYSFSTLKILATVKHGVSCYYRFSRFSTLKILATVKQESPNKSTDGVLVPLRF